MIIIIIMILLLKLKSRGQKTHKKISIKDALLEQDTTFRDVVLMQ